MKLIITLFIVMLLLTACAKQGKKKEVSTDISYNTEKTVISNFGVDDVFTDEGDLTPPSFGE